MNGKPPSLDWICFKLCWVTNALGLLPSATSPWTALPVLFVSGPVKLLALAAGHGVVGFDRYEVHNPFAHGGLVSQLIPATTCASVRGVLTDLSAASARPWRNAPSKDGSCAPNRPASAPVVRWVASSRLTRLFCGAVPPKC